MAFARRRSPSTPATGSWVNASVAAPGASPPRSTSIGTDALDRVGEGLAHSVLELQRARGPLVLLLHELRIGAPLAGLRRDLLGARLRRRDDARLEANLVRTVRQRDDTVDQPVVADPPRPVGRRRRFLDHLRQVLLLDLAIAQGADGHDDADRGHLRGARRQRRFHRARRRRAGRCRVAPLLVPEPFPDPCWWISLAVAALTCQIGVRICSASAVLISETGRVPMPRQDVPAPCSVTSSVRATGRANRRASGVPRRA